MQSKAFYLGNRNIWSNIFGFDIDFKNNTNLDYAIENEKSDVGNWRETFFFKSVISSQSGYFCQKGGFLPLITAIF